MPGYRRVARGALGSKGMDFAPPELSTPDPRPKLRKRLHDEMEALRGILSKAETLVRSSKNADKGRAASRRGKGGRFLAAEARSEEADPTAFAKKRKTMSPVEIIEPGIMKATDQTPCAKKRKSKPPVKIIEPANQTLCAKKSKTMALPVEIIKPRTLESADKTPCAKKSKTMAPPVEIIKPRTLEAADQTLCAKKSKTMAPPVEIIKPRIMEADRTPCAKKTKTTPPVEVIEPRISKDEILILFTRLSPLSSNMPERILQFLKKECTGQANEKVGELEIDLESMRRSAMFELLKLLDEFAEEEKRRKKEEESMNVSRSSPGQIDDGEFVVKEDCDATTDACSAVAPVKGLCSPPRILQDGEIEKEEGVICGDASAIAAEKFAETAQSSSNSSSSSSSSGSSSSSSDGSSGSSSSSSSSSGSSSGSSCSDSSDSDSSDCEDECVTSTPAPAVRPKTDASAMEMQHEVLSSVAAEKSAETKNIPSNSSSSLLEDGEIEEELENDGASTVAAEKPAESWNIPSSSSSPLLEDGEIQEEQECGSASPVAAEKSANDECVVTSNPAVKKTSKRQIAYEKLEEMERNGKPIFDWINPVH